MYDKRCVQNGRFYETERYSEILKRSEDNYYEVYQG